jgi:hypothetical protein
VTLNAGKRGPSVSVGPRGGRVNVGRRGLTATATLIGTASATCGAGAASGELARQLGRQPPSRFAATLSQLSPRHSVSSSVPR